MIRLDGLQHWQVPSARGVPSRGPPAKLLADQPLAQLPQGHGRQLIASLGRGQAAAAVVEVHPSQPLQLGGRRAVHGRGGSLLHGFGERSSQGKQQGIHPPVTMNGGVNHISRMD